MRRNIAALLVPLVGLLTVDVALAAKKPANAPLLKLFETSWQEDLANDPISATALGDHRYDALLPDMSVEDIARRNQLMFTRMAALRKIDKTKLEKADQLNYDLFERETRIRLNEAQFKPYLYAIQTGGGPQLLPELSEVHPFQTVKDYDNWIARINASGVYLDQWIVLLGQGATERRTQPRIIVQKVLEQIKPQLVTDPEASGVLPPFKKMPASFDAATKDRLIAAGKAAIQTVGRAGVPALRQVLPRCLSTRFARHDRHIRHAGRRPVLQGPRQVLHDHRQPRCDAHPQHRPRGSEENPRRDGEDARGHQFPRARWTSS